MCSVIRMTLNVHVQRIASAIAIAGTLGAGAWLGIASASADPFDQRSFPCLEDEVLGYAPEFGPDKVGCIHVDVLIQEAISDYN
jgi:hypothetical protein